MLARPFPPFGLPAPPVLARLGSAGPTLPAVLAHRLGADLALAAAIEVGTTAMCERSRLSFRHRGTPRTGICGKSRCDLREPGLERLVEDEPARLTASRRARPDDRCCREVRLDALELVGPLEHERPAWT